MKPLAVVFALALAAPPGEVAAPASDEVSPGTAVDPLAAPPAEEQAAVVAPLAGPVEGPSPPPRSWTGKQLVVDRNDPNDWWNRRDRRMRDTAIALGGVAGLAFVGSGMFLYASKQTRGSAEVTDDAALGSAVVGFVAAGALIGVGTALGVSRREGWRPPIDRTIKEDPRRDPWWVNSDRRLRRVTIALGVTTGVLAISLPVTYAIGNAVIDYPDCGEGDCQGLDLTGIGLFALMVTEGVMLGVSVVALVSAGGVWGGHRDRLRRWKMGLTAGGLQLQF